MVILLGFGGVFGFSSFGESLEESNDGDGALESKESRISQNDTLLAVVLRVKVPGDATEDEEELKVTGISPKAPRGNGEGILAVLGERLRRLAEE